GTDVTEAFEAHHLNPNTVKVLEKFYKRDAKTPRNSPFTFKDDGFYRTLKTKVWEEIQKIPNKESDRTAFICDSLLFTCLVSSTITCWAKDYWIVMLSYIVASVTMAWVIVAAHNYIHKRTSWRMYIFNIGLWSYRDFRVSHALSHHLYPNTLMDLEVSGFEPIVFWNPRKERPFYADYAVIIEQILFPFMFIMNFLKSGFEPIVFWNPRKERPFYADYAVIIEQILFPFMFIMNFLKRFSLNFTRPGFFTQHYRWHDVVTGVNSEHDIRTMAPKESDYLEIAQQRAIEKKTHVSFPQLKYPSLRDEGLRDSMQWLTGKAIDDGAEGLWRGTDITEAFEVHHLNPSTVKVLEKFYKRDAKTPRNSPFTFKDDGFYQTLKNKVWEEIQKIPNKESIRTSFICDSLLFTCLVSSTITCWAKDYWIVMLSYIVASVSMAWVMVAAHNYIHKRTNWRIDFRVSHALSHHLFANTLMDLEVSGFEPIVFWNPRKEQPFYAKYSVVLEQILFPFMFIMNFLKRFSRNFTHPGFFTQHYRWHDGLGFLLPVWMYITGGATFYDTLTIDVNPD
ncbi:unnamed protein product, partial [Leptidea sinapis]